MIRIGTVQTEMVPGKWYFLHTPRNQHQNVTAEGYAIDGVIQATGGLVYDNTSNVSVSTTTVIDDLTAEEGVSSNDYLKMMVRFVAVDGEEGAYNIQFGTGRWIAGRPNDATCTNNQYIAGEAGKYNFYLPAINGAHNSKGRFAWNAYNMQDIVDNNGAGATVVFWAEGEVTAENEGWTTEEDIAGNKIWEIFDVVVLGDVDKWSEAFDDLINDYDDIVTQGDGTIIDQLIAGENVGNKPGNYRPEDVEAFLALHAQVEELLFLAESEGMEAIQNEYSTASDLKAFNDRYVAAWNHLIENKVSLAMTGIEPGYYTFSSVMFFYTNKKDTTFYTQEEANEINAENGVVDGDEGYVAAGDVKEITSTQVPAPKKSLYSAPAQGSDGEMGDWLAWGPQQPQAEYLWKIEAVEGRPTEYRMTNVANGKTHISIGREANSKLALNDTATVCFDWRNDNETVRYADAEGREVEKKVVSFNIRSSSQPENNYYYLHCRSHSNGAGTGSWIVGWCDGGATRWYMTPVDEATVDEWTNGPEAQIRAKVQKGDSIAAAFPDQLEIAKDLFANMDTSRNVANINTFSSPYHCPAEGSMEQLFDGIYNSTNNFWHSNWQSGNDYAYSSTNGTNYFVVEDVDATINGGLAVMVARRPITNDHLTQLTVYGTNDEYSPEDDLANIKEGGEDLYTWTELGVLNTPYGNGAEYISSNAIAFEGQYRFYKFVATGTTNSRGYFHMGEFALYPAKTSKRYETTQYDVRKAEADALAEAVAVWNERGYTEDNTELLADEEFLQAYDNIVAAGEAWGKVFVDPTPLREAIAAAPAEKMFVFGNNPGQWKAGTATPATAVAAAEAYNMSGVYTPAESEAHIAALANAEADIFASANKVETGKWYRFKFATEEMFENYGWDKNGSKAAINSAGIETAPSLWGKTVAVGKSVTSYIPYETEEGEADTATVRTVEVTKEWYEGDNLCFFENVEFANGEDLFRFIQATDTSYMIQNKATGLFIQAGHPVKLSAIPSYFTIEAIGAGATLIGYTDVMGNADNHRYLHGERPSGLLTKWHANTLGSNSMMFIEEAETVTEEPSTEYRTKLWPGQVYAYTYPVDVTISDGATAYAAGLAVTGNRSTVVLQPMENATIKAGTPFVMIANPALAKDQERAGEYISSADRLKQIAAEILAENGQYGRNEQALAKVRLNDEYAIVTMNHGMTVNTNVDANYSLRGTMEHTMVEAGQAILPNENGFGHTIVNKSIAAYVAWIASDFDPESEEVLGNISIMIGEIGDSIVTPDTPDDEEELPVGVALITDASQLSSPFTCSSDGALECLIDKDPNTYWHSDWTGGVVEGGHYLQVELAEPVTGTFSLYMKRRLATEDHPSRVRITGSETADFTSETLDITVDMPNAISGAESNSEEWMISIPTRFLRIEATDCAGVNYEFRGYWHAAELQIYKTSNNSSWTTVIEERIAALADYPGMQAELQGAYDKYSALPEDSITVSMMTEVNGVYTRIMSAIDSYEKLPSLIALADSVLETKTDAELLAACEDAKKINAQSSTSEQILTAYSTLSDALAPYLKLSIPMEQWNFTEWYDAENGLYYNLDTQHGLARACLKLSGEHQSLTNVDVPESFIYNNEKYCVVALGDGWTYSGSNQMLETLVLPSSIKHIYNSALGGMEKLQNIIIAATTAPSMDGWQGIEFNRLKVTIPNGSINSYSLSPNWSSALLVQETPVEISLALSAPGELRYQILDHVDYLKEVNKLAITSGTLNTTDWNALSAMPNLMELDIEACGNTNIPGGQFRGSHLEVVKLPAGLKQINYGAFANSHRLASVTIPEGVTFIDGEAFQLCSSLKDVVLNEGLTEIGYSAFHMCDITSLTMPSTLKRINNDAFAYNYRLKELNLNEGLESIMHNAFNECDSLKEVVLPSTLTICYIPFAYCDNLTSLTSNALIPAGTDNNCPVSGSNMANVVLKVPAWSLDEYKFAPGWSEIPQIVASDYQPENIVISKDFTLRIKESEVDANYRPNVALKWSNVWSYDNQENGYYERGNLTIAPGAMLNANSFSMFYSPLGQYYDNPNNWDGQREYNTNSLLVEGSMRADDVTITLMNRNSAWQFISFPFDVRMSDMVPVDPNTYWVVREYSGAERANGNMEETWTDLDADDVLKAGKGYIMHCYSEEGEPVMFQVKADRTSMTRQNIFISSDNEVMLEEHVAEFEHNSSWNLIGNPYPCYYDIRCTDFSAPVTVWDSYYQNYVAKSPLDDDYILYPGEAFFVQRPVEQESIVFYAEGRQTDRYAREMTNARKSATTDRKVYNIVLKGEKTADRTRVVLNEKASMAYEMNCDASKFDAMSRDASQIFTVAGNARMAINERPMGSGIVELGVVIASEGVYTIALKQAGEKKVVLEDRKLGVCTVLSADNEYTFSAVPGEAKGRFFLNFDESATGIDGISAGQTNKEPAYNTTGVRVEDGQKGLVIKEGKKIVNK